MGIRSIYSSAIGFFRNPRWGLVSFVTSAVLGLVGWFVPLGNISKFVGALIFLTFTGFVVAANLVYSSLGIYCLQKEPISSAKAQYTREYPVTDGYAEFEVYVDVPDWVEDFSVEIDVNGPFEIGTWDEPGGTNFDDGVLHCHHDMPGFPFTLRFAAEPEDIKDGSYNVYFRNKGGRKLHKIVLDGQENLDTDFDRQDVDQSIAEDLGMPEINDIE